MSPMLSITRRTALLGALALALPLAQAQAPAQNWPTRPVTVVANGGPGGALDLMLKIVTPALQQHYGQPFVTDYKAGGAGQIGINVIAKAKPDGYTIGPVGGATIVIGPMTQKLSYDPMKDLVYVARFVTQSNILYVKNDSPVKTLADLVDYGRKNPDKISFGSTGQGTTTHLTAAALFGKTGVKATHIPFKSSAEQQTAVLSGTIDVGFENISPVVMGQIKGGTVRPLAVTSKERNPLLPNVPAVSETVPGFEISTWYGWAVPTGTPREIVDSLSAATQMAMSQPAVRDKFVESGMVPAYLPPREFLAFINDEVVRWTPVVKSVDLKQ